MAQWLAEVVRETATDQRTILLLACGTDELNTHPEADRLHSDGFQFALASETYADKVHSGDSERFCDASAVFRVLLPH